MPNLARFLTIAIVSAVQAFAWNGTGHRAVALVAYDQLTPKTREAVAAILAEHPQAATLLRAELKDGESAPAFVFANAAKWPDDVRNPPYSATYHHQAWHYVNLPYVPDQYAAKIKASSIPEAGELLIAMDYNLKLLKKSDAPKADRAVAICWVAHLVGDIHQPLHSVALFTPALPKGDKGGNSLLVRKTAEAKTTTNLHSVWDSMLGSGNTKSAAESIASRLESEYPVTKKLPDVAKHTSPRSWAEESLAAAKSNVYLSGKLPFVVETKGEKPKPEDVPALTADYLTNSRALADLRAAQAAYRLAALLNDALGR